ncbi:hypothetical protein [Zoogloea sp.]|uniref:hypothetical protein n=1 Tax=Zoogloea sp. TaxID=49181 RepID=UPI0035AF1678
MPAQIVFSPLPGDFHGAFGRRFFGPIRSAIGKRRATKNPAFAGFSCDTPEKDRAVVGHCHQRGAWRQR